MSEHNPELDMAVLDLPILTTLSDLDNLIIRDVSSATLAHRITVNTLRNSIGGVPPIEDLPVEAIDAPTWRLDGFEGGWRVSIDSIVTDATYYFVYYFEPESGTYKYIGYVTEFREDSTYGPLILDIMAPYEDPPRRQFRLFKVKTITADAQGSLSDSESAWADIKLPQTYVPTAPTLETSGYPIISYKPMPDGGFGYDIAVKILGVAGEKDYITNYELQRATDGGTDPFPSDAAYVRLTEHNIQTFPAPKTIVYHDSDRALKPGHKYRFRVRAVAMNGNRSDWSAYQEVTLTDDSTAPDAPVFTVTAEDLHLRLDFNKPLQSGDECLDWYAWKVQFKKDGGSMTDIGPEDGLLMDMVYYHGIADGDITSTFKFRAKAVDWARNESDWTSESDGDTPNKVSGDAIADRTIAAGNVALLALTNAEMEDLTVITSKIADLNITETKIGDTSISTPKFQSGIINSVHINALQILTAHIKALNVTGDKMAMNTVSLNKLTFTPLTSSGGTAEVIATINASAEGIRITGDNLAIDADTTFTSTVEIQGLLTSSGGIATGSGTTGLFIGKYGASDHWFHFKKDDTQVARMLMTSVGEMIFVLSSKSATGRTAEIQKDKIGVYDTGNPKAELSTDGSTGYLKIVDTQVVATRQSGIQAMSNVSAPGNWNADTVTVAELADIVGTLIVKLRTHGLVGN